MPMDLTRSLTPPAMSSRFFCATPFKSEILLLTTVLEAVLRILPMTLEMVTETASPSLLPPKFVIEMDGSYTETELSLTATALISPSLTVSFLMTTFLPASADADEALAFSVSAVSFWAVLVVFFLILF